MIQCRPSSPNASKSNQTNSHPQRHPPPLNRLHPCSQLFPPPHTSPLLCLYSHPALHPSHLLHQSIFTHEVPPFVKLFHILPNTPPVAFCSLHAAFRSAALASWDVRLYCVRPAYWPADDRLLPAAAAEMAPGTTSVDLRGVASAFGGGEAEEDLFSSLPPWEDWEPERGL